MLCALLLSSCGPVSSLFGGASKDGNPSEKTQTSSSLPAEEKDSGEAETLAPLMGPPGMDDRPPLPGQSGRGYTAEGLPKLQPMRGISAKQLFAEDIKDPSDRIKRVENAVVDLRTDFEAVLPSIMRLVAVEKDMQELTSQLESLLQNEPPPPIEDAAIEKVRGNAPLQKESLPPPQNAPAAQPPSPSAAPAQTPPPMATSPPVPVMATAQSPPPTRTQTQRQSAPAAAPAVSIPGNAQVRRLRMGEESTKTRLVFDAGGPVNYRHDLDNNEHLLIVELPGAGWAGPRTWSSDKSPLVASYTVQPMDNGAGSRVIIQLKKPTAIIYETKLAPDKSGGDHRVVIDLKK